jgi:hypothetical protein
VQACRSDRAIAPSASSVQPAIHALQRSVDFGDLGQRRVTNRVQGLVVFQLNRLVFGIALEWLVLSRYVPRHTVMTLGQRAASSHQNLPETFSLDWLLRHEVYL